MPQPSTVDSRNPSSPTVSSPKITGSAKRLDDVLFDRNTFALTSCSEIESGASIAALVADAFDLPQFLLLFLLFLPL
jgi:hypothetical protein